MMKVVLRINLLAVSLTHFSTISHAANDVERSASQLTTLGKPDDFLNMSALPNNQLGPDPVSRSSVQHLTADTFPQPASFDIPSFHIVNFYSPKCIHCKHFEPTYLSVFAFLKPLRKHRVYVEMVDCLKDTEVCDDHGIKGTPTVRAVYGDAMGERREVQMPSSARTFWDVGNWVQKEFKAYWKLIQQKIETVPIGEVKVEMPAGSADQKKSDKPVEKEQDEKESDSGQATDITPETAPLKEVDTPDPKLQALRSVVDSFLAMDLINPNGEVVHASDSTFDSFLPLVDTQADKDASAEHAGLVLFHSPLCPHCVHFQPTYRDLAKDLKARLAVYSVSVPENPRLTSVFHIEGYPSLFFIRGSHRWSWELDRGIAGLSRYAVEFSKLEVKELHSPEDLEKARKAEEVFSVLLMNEDDDAEVLKTYLSAIEGSYLHVKPYISHNNDILPTLARPSVAVLRKDDYDSPYIMNMTADEEVDDVCEFILARRRGIVTEMTPWNMKDLLRSKQLVFALLNPDGDASEYRDLRRVAADIRSKFRPTSTSDLPRIRLDDNGVVSGGDEQEVNVVYLNPSKGGYKSLLKGFFPTSMMGNGKLKIPTPFIGVIEPADGKYFSMDHAQHDGEEEVADKGKMLWGKSAVMARLDEVRNQGAEGLALDHRWRLPSFTGHIGLIISLPFALYLIIYKVLPWIKGKRGYGRVATSAGDGFRKFE